MNLQDIFFNRLTFIVDKIGKSKSIFLFLFISAQSFLLGSLVPYFLGLKGFWFLFFNILFMFIFYCYFSLEIVYKFLGGK